MRCKSGTSMRAIRCGSKSRRTARQSRNGAWTLTWARNPTSRSLSVLGRAPVQRAVGLWPGAPWRLLSSLPVSNSSRRTGILARRRSPSGRFTQSPTKWIRCGASALAARQSFSGPPSESRWHQTHYPSILAACRIHHHDMSCRTFRIPRRARRREWWMRFTPHRPSVAPNWQELLPRKPHLSIGE